MAKKATRKPAARRRSAAKKRTAAKTPRTSRKKGAARATATRLRRSKVASGPPLKKTRRAAAVRGALARAVTALVDLVPWSNSERDAIQLLEQEHRQFEELLDAGAATTDRAAKKRRELLDTLTAALNAHELMEEKVLYPALRAHSQAREVVLEGFEEHHVVDLIVQELHAVSADDEQWGAKFKVLKENIEHHIEEEEGQMFRLARGIFSRDELRDLAVRMRALRQPGRRPAGT